MSYVLAEFNNQTRKIQGAWNQKSYKNLMREIRSKFSIERDQELEIKVYDRQNDKYFSIDKHEMSEISKGGLIRIVRSKTRNKGKSTPKKAKPNQSMKPPGVPPYSKEDDLKRNRWKVNSRVEIYSEGQRKWQKGQVVNIFDDNEGEWLVIKYGGFSTKEIQRFSNYIRPIQPAQKQKTKNQNQNQQPQKQKEKNSKKQNQPQAQSKKAKKEKKPEKITTQSKYRKKEKIATKEDKENEIHVKGNSQHIKKYIDRACALLRGRDAGTGKTQKTASDDDSKKEEVADEEKVCTKYDVIELYGTGRAMGFVVSTAEIVKRIVGNLYQVTILESIPVTDVWVPLEQGLGEVETTRPLPQLRIILAVNEKDIDKTAQGYQEPIAQDEFAANLEYHYDTSFRGGRGRGRGRARKGGRGGRGRGRGGRGKRGRGAF